METVRGRRATIASGGPRPRARGLAVSLAALAASLLFTASAVGTAGSVELSVEGHTTLGTAEIERILLPGRGAELSEAALAARLDSLVSRLSGAGRPFARAEASWSTRPDGLFLRVVVDEGPELRIGSVEYRGAASIEPARLRERAAARPGGVLSRDAIERDIDAMLSAYERSGRPFASVRPRVEGPPDEPALVFEIEEGPLVRFDGLAVTGNERTRPYVLLRESGVVPGAPYDAGVVARIRPRLERLGYFSSVDEPWVVVEPESGAATVGVDVVEAGVNRITGVLGYAPSAEGDDDGITGLVDMRLANIAGTGREAEVRWQRLRQAYTQASFAYTEPWLLGAPIDVGVKGGQVIRDTLYTTTEADLVVTARMGERVRVTWSIGGERFVSGVPGEPTTTSYRTAIGARYDGSDAPANPSRGIRLEGSIEYAAKEVADEGERSGTFRLAGGLFVPVRPRHVIALLGSLAAISTSEDEVPFHELLTLGGASNLRGYREEQFRGRRTALGTVEYRLLLSRRARVIVFVDAGYYLREGSNSAKDVKLGYGIGLRGETRLGILALDYGLGEGDSPRDGKLHVGLIREF